MLSLSESWLQAERFLAEHLLDVPDEILYARRQVEVASCQTLGWRRRPKRIWQRAEWRRRVVCLVRDDADSDQLAVRPDLSVVLGKAAQDKSLASTSH